MAGLFASGHAVDLVLAVLAIEAAAIAIFRAHGRAALLDLIAQLMAGAFLLLALRSALTGAPWGQTAILLAASGPAHLFDLVRRWRTRSHDL